MEENKRTEISETGKTGLIERLTADIKTRNASTVAGIDGNAAVIACDSRHFKLMSTGMMLEGVDFDLMYFPLKHLGYKAVVKSCSKIFAMNGTPEQLTVSLGISAKLSIEHIEEFYAGIKAACSDLDIDLVGIDFTASVNGLVISISTVGNVEEDKIARLNGARINDLICLTGDLGAAYMGLHLLEREKRAFEGHPSPHPDFEGWEYLLRRQLKPSARKDVISSFDSAGFVPTAMTDLSEGLASGLLRICDKSDCGARIYLDRLPIARETYDMAEQLHADPVVAALNGGDDYELLFTVPLTMQEKIVSIGGIEIIGHISPPGTGVFLVAPDGSDIPVTTP